MNGDDDHSPIDFPIDGVLDLHIFHPRDVKEVLLEYIDACQQKGILDLRIIHGKGRGVLRETVHKILAGQADVLGFSLAGDGAGGWGATVVRLRPK